MDHFENIHRFNASQINYVLHKYFFFQIGI